MTKAPQPSSPMPTPGTEVGLACGLGAVLARRKLLGIGSVVLLAALGWIYLGVMTAGMVAAGDSLGRALIDALCGTRLGPAGGDSITVPATMLVLAMWVAMVFAMMLPSAGPMIVTYAEIADTAARQGKRVVSPLTLTAGYITVWLGFAAAATALQTALTLMAVLDASMVAASGLSSGAVFVGAGLYQFSALKHACVTQCQRPFAFFFANWRETPGGVFRLGLRQGLYCVGCCFAMMLVMFAVGVMNVVWMAALGAIMTVEKVSTTPRFSRAVGGALIAIGAGIIVYAVVGKWRGVAA
jgi:predicted metal-binding membrane protein